MTATIELPEAMMGTHTQDRNASGSSPAEHQAIHDDQIVFVLDGSKPASGQAAHDDHAGVAAGTQSPPAKAATTASDAPPGVQTTGGQPPHESQASFALGPILRDPVLGILADILDDFEKVRIANANRVRILTRTEADTDGEERGFGLTEAHREVRKLIATVTAFEAAEHESILSLQRTLRKHPLAGFQKRYRGIGEKQFARLLATIGDPYWNDLHERPRTVSELWAFSGYHVLHAGGQAVLGTQVTDAPGVAPKRSRGKQSNWSEMARKRCFVIAESLMKGGRKAEGDGRGEQDPSLDRFRIVYDDTRAKYAEATHATECVRCGPAGKPAQPGSALSDAHKHARALRAVAKELLKALWIEAREIHTQTQAARERSTPIEAALPDP